MSRQEEREGNNELECQSKRNRFGDRFKWEDKKKVQEPRRRKKRITEVRSSKRGEAGPQIPLEGNGLGTEEKTVRGPSKSDEGLGGGGSLTGQKRKRESLLQMMIPNGKRV